METCLYRLPWLILACVTLWGSTLEACSTPVFRYALQRWQPDDYEVLVLHRQPLTDDENELLEILQQAARDEHAPANMTVRTVDLSQSVDEADQHLLAAVDLSGQVPWMLVQYPRFTKTDRLAFSGPLDRETIRMTIDSPARQEVRERILAGDSVVWVLIESGDSAKDAEAEEVLRQRLAYLEKNLELPNPADTGTEDLVASDEFSSEKENDAPLRFAYIRVRRDDPEERGFVAMLVNSESDLHEFEEPIAIPLFGRARSHYALVGKGINDDNIDLSSQFLCGACSCEVKSQNPGADMLFRVNWEELITMPDVDHEPLPELTGLGALEVDDEPADETIESAAISTESENLAPPVDVTAAPVSVSNAETKSSYSLFGPAVVVVILGLLVVVFGTVVIQFRQKSTH